MRVLLVSSNSGSRGGGEIYLRYLAQGLSGLGCDVHALLAVDPTMDELAGGLGASASVHRLPLANTFRRSARSLGAVIDVEQRRRVRAFIRRLAPDIVHVNQQVAEDGLDLMLAAADACPAFVSTLHLTHSASELNARMGSLRDLVAERVLSRLAPPFIVVSEAAARRLLRRPRLADADVTVVHPAVPPVDPALCADARRSARSEWRVADCATVIGAVGRIEDQKNPLFLADLLADLTAAGRDVRLVWIGDGAMRPSLEARAARRSVRDRLIIDGWREDARQRMNGFDILAMPSRFEGLPLALIEAMHAGLAVCASDADGMPEAVTDGRDGLIRPLSEPGAWRKAVGNLADDPALRARLGAAARETARTRFGLDAMARRTLALYRATADKGIAERTYGRAG